MNRAILNELQRQRCYPSITMLINTTPGTPLTPSEVDGAMRLACHADDRLDGDVSDILRRDLIFRLTDMIREQAGQPSTHALALFLSPDHAATVRLGCAIDERVTIGDTFTTRDLVADQHIAAILRY